MAQDFELDLVEGELLIRDAVAPFPLENPTKVTGTHDTGEGGTGAVTNGAFTSPTISFETVALGFPVFVDATFTPASPATGVIDADGNVTINAPLNVHLDIVVGTTDPPLLEPVCEGGPVNLTLGSTAPWNPDTKRVTLADTDFAVPNFATTPDCIDVVTDSINEQLGGSPGGGHSIEMTLEGDLTLPTAPACKTLTDLDVTPAGETLLGDPVTMTVTVTQDPAGAGEDVCDEVGSGDVPGGVVELRVGNTVVGTAELDGTGVATFATDDIQAGTFPLTARYRGGKPFGKSVSDPVDHKVASPVAVTVDLPESAVIGEGWSEFDVMLTNTGLGSAVINARPQIGFDRLEGGANFVTTMINVEYWNGSAWVASPVSTDGPAVWASLGPLTGFPLAIGAEVTRKVRVGFDLTPGLIALTPATAQTLIRVAEVDPTTGAPAVNATPEDAVVGGADGLIRLIEEERRPTETAGFLAPHTLRQGQTLHIDIQTSGSVNSRDPSGTWTVFFDGAQVAVRSDATAPELGQLPDLPASASGHAEFPIPDDAPTGTRVVTVKYSGDELFEPSQWSGTVSVLDSRGTTYVCRSKFFGGDNYNVNFAAHANLGSVRPSGGTVGLAQLDVAMYADRGNATQLGFFFDPEEPVAPPMSDFFITVQAIDFTFGDGQGAAGTGTAHTFTVANKDAMQDDTRPVDPNPDMVFGFKGETGSATVTGEPGDVVPITVQQVKITASFWTGGDPFPIEITCAPSTPASTLNLGDVTVAGTTLAVDAPTVTREGDTVTLNATAFPIGTPGTVEFRDGTDTLTVTPARIGDGTATFTTDALDAGTHQLSARFFGGLAGSSTTSAPVMLEVLPETDCAAFAEEGDGAVVRLVYMELLGRCPDQAGFDHWVGRLEGGTSAEAFARTISRTNEAVGRVVDDAYDTMLGRAPDAAGRTFWIGRLQASGRYDQLLADLAGSAEFWALSGSTNAGFVTRVYERLLDRAPETAGLDYWVGRLDGGTSRRVLVRSLANLDEPLGRLVDDAYDEILSRSPGSSERSIGIDDLRDTGDRSGLYAELIGRPEFDDRAQDFPNPED